MDVKNLTIVSGMRRADELAQVLGCKFEAPGIFPVTSNILIYGGFYEGLILAEKFMTYAPDSNCYLLFTGIDICELRDAVYSSPEYCQALLGIICKVKVLALGRRMEDELRQFGIEPEGSVILPVDVDHRLFENRTAIVVHKPADNYRRFLFRVPILERLAKAVGIVTYDDPAEVYEKALLNVRITRYDGQPYDVIAMAQIGIQSVVSYCDFPYTISVVDSESDDAIYGMVLDVIKNYTPDPGEIDEMQTYYRERYSPESCRRSFLDI